MKKFVQLWVLKSPETTVRVFIVKIPLGNLETSITPWTLTVDGLKY